MGGEREHPGEKLRGGKQRMLKVSVKQTAYKKLNEGLGEAKTLIL